MVVFFCIAIDRVVVYCCVDTWHKVLSTLSSADAAADDDCYYSPSSLYIILLGRSNADNVHSNKVEGASISRVKRAVQYEGLTLNIL